VTRSTRRPPPPAPGRQETGRHRLPEAVRVGGGAALHGAVRAPGDKSISHRAVLIGALADGRSVVRGLSDGEDVRRTVVAVAQLGAGVEPLGDDGEGGPAALAVFGGRGRLHAPAAPIECGNSGTSMRLLMGVVAGLDGETVLVGDGSLSRRPMDRVAAPLAAMGAGVSGTGERCRPPVTVRGARLRGVTWTPEIASAQVKSAILLAGLGAEGETVVHEPVRTRTHTEELLEAAGAAITVEDDGAARTVRIGPSEPLAPLDLDVPGDPSQAAFWLVAATVVPGSDVVVRNVYAGAERTGFVAVLERMGAAVRPLARTSPSPGPHGPAGPGAAGPVADLAARAAPLRATVVHAEEIPSLDEVPVLAVAAACAAGTTTFVDMRELRVKETDRLEAVVRLLRALGAGSEVVGDDLLVHGTAPEGGPGRLRHAEVDSGGDHRIAMAAAVAALAAGPGESSIGGFGAVGTSYPAFLDHLRALGGTSRVALVAIDGPAGSGKSTVSRALAARLGLDRLDTGAMYRAVAWAVLAKGVDPGASEEVADLARRAVIEVGPERVAIDGTVVTREIRTPAVNRAVSVVAANPGVRAALVERQRTWVASHGGGVVEGRDIGTVVFPEADLKVFLTASPEERARRRRGDEAPDGVARRDRIDSTRPVSPLAAADDARQLDTTGRSVDDVVGEILSWL
jgi:3-phosphoshikimate 1-carboxyvinyltransferase